MSDKKMHMPEEGALVKGVFKVMRASDPEFSCGVSGYELVEVFSEDVAQMLTDYDVTGRPVSRMAVLREGRLLMRQTTDETYAKLEQQASAAQSEAAKLREEFKRLDKELVEARKSNANYKDSADLMTRTIDKVRCDLATSEDRRRKMEADLGKLREVLGSERFQELLSK